MKYVVPVIIAATLPLLNTAYGQAYNQPTHTYVAQKYRFVNQQGKRIHIDRKVPEQNRQIIAKQLLQNNQQQGKIVQDSIGEKYYTTGRVEKTLTPKTTQGRKNKTVHGNAGAHFR